MQNNKPFVDLFTVWLRNIPRCSFATSFLSDIDRISIIARQIDDELANTLNAFLDGWGEANVAGAIAFPEINSELDLCNLIKKLCKNSRWDYSTSQINTYPGNLISLKWRTKDNLQSQTMGFAPIFTMPVTRRAPVTAIALWPGAPRKDNQQGPTVSFMDMPSVPPFSKTVATGADKSSHKRALETTQSNVSQLLGKFSTETEEPANKFLESTPWRDHAFRLSEATRSEL